MIGLIIYLGIMIIAFIIVLKYYISSLNEIEELKKSIKELLNANHELIIKNKKNGK